MLGYTREEYIGHHIAEFHADQDLISEILGRLRSGEELRDVEARMRCKDGSIKHVLISTNALWEDGRFIQTRCFTCDITDGKRAEEALRENERSLKQADHRKNEFLAILAHELRNPLASIYNAIELFRAKAPLDSELETAREILARQVRHLSRLVDDLMDISRITSGKIRLQRERFGLATAVSNAVQSSQPLIVASAHQLTVTLPPEPIYVDGDPMRLTQVFSNLLINAAKYTEKGRNIRVTVGRQNGMAVISVVDTGIGSEFIVRLPAIDMPA
jgi:signal transduction histidine kinase